MKGSIDKKRKPHRRADCGTSQKITIAYYLLSQNNSDSEKLQAAMEHPNLSAIDKAYFDQRYLFIFNDNSLLGYDEKNGFYVADSWGRRDMGKKPTLKGINSRKEIFVS